ncbi:rod shape-determining protein [Geomonas sp. RF6]|uniref:rod shape-determining protein n=1 Tax=Geomonas sp. RF6 TaxID=2897342 RepID=UPI001E317AA3|nr:rod shape-determining protein [Geomonas sp. RF6]UFS69284.1 rod shape-determining protein [Geomonas sp. RF6]
MLHSEQWRQHVALDVGTATTRIAIGGSPAIEKPSRLGSEPALSGGVVVNAEAMSQILKPLLEKARSFGVIKPWVLACAPSDASSEERQLLTESIMGAGAASVSVIPEPLAAAIGAGVDVSSPYAQMVIDIGEGVTDCAVIRASKVYATAAVRIGCARMRARQSRCSGRSSGVAVAGCDSDAAAVAVAEFPVLAEIADTVDLFLRSLPDHVGCEVIESGICLTGGGALIPGVRDYLAGRTGIEVKVAGSPRNAVVEGARVILPVILMLNRWK